MEENNMGYVVINKKTGRLVSRHYDRQSATRIKNMKKNKKELIVKKT